MALGRNIDRIERNIESIESKIAKTFKRPKNREDGSDFDDFRTNSIAATRTISGKFFARAGERKNERTSDRTEEKSEKKIHLVTGRKYKSTVSVLLSPRPKRWIGLKVDWVF